MDLLAEAARVANAARTRELQESMVAILGAQDEFWQLYHAKAPLDECLPPLRLLHGLQRFVLIAGSDLRFTPQEQERAAHLVLTVLELLHPFDENAWGESLTQLSDLWEEVQKRSP